MTTRTSIHSHADAGLEGISLLFQYGSNMSSDRLNGGDRLKGAACVVGTAITVDDYELRFDLLSRKSGATADLVVGSGRKIWGVLYKIPTRLIARETSSPDKSMDAIEGTNYRRIQIQLRVPNDEVVKTAITYIGTDAARREGICATADYVGHILKGCKDHALPLEYIEYVRGRIRANNPQLLSE